LLAANDATAAMAAGDIYIFDEEDDDDEDDDDDVDDGELDDEEFDTADPP
jgi:hypothetical protein